jgi:hypothetical protein
MERPGAGESTCFWSAANFNIRGERAAFVPTPKQGGPYGQAILPHEPGIRHSRNALRRLPAGRKLRIRMRSQMLIRVDPAHLGEELTAMRRRRAVRHSWRRMNRNGNRSAGAHTAAIDCACAERDAKRSSNPALTEWDDVIGSLIRITAINLGHAFARTGLRRIDEFRGGVDGKRSHDGSPKLVPIS